jgi:hypothetical protein
MTEDADRSSAFSDHVVTGAAYTAARQCRRHGSDLDRQSGCRFRAQTAVRLAVNKPPYSSPGLASWDLRRAMVGPRVRRAWVCQADQSKPQIALLHTRILSAHVSDMADPSRLSPMQAFRGEVTTGVRVGLS